MSRKNGRQMPSDLARGRQRFQAWRRTRTLGTRIPESLWALAVKLAGVHGVACTANALRLDYYALRRRAGSSPSDAEPATGAFMELSVPPPAPLRECLVEWEDSLGARMRLHMKGCDMPDLVALGRSFWTPG